MFELIIRSKAMFIKQMLTGLCAFTLSFSVFAAGEATPNTTRAAPTGGMFAAFGKMSIDSAVADKENIKDSASYFRMGGEFTPHPWIFGGGIAGIFYSDSSGFSQRVQDQYGTVTNAKSTADSFNLFGEAGYSYSLVETFKVELLAGYELVLSSSRKIDSCADCASEDIDVKAGLYVSPRIKLLVNNFYISLTAQQFIAGDVKNAFFLGVGLAI